MRIFGAEFSRRLSVRGHPGAPGVYALRGSLREPRKLLERSSRVEVDEFWQRASDSVPALVEQRQLLRVSDGKAEQDGPAKAKHQVPHLEPLSVRVARCKGRSASN